MTADRSPSWQLRLLAKELVEGMHVTPLPESVKVDFARLGSGPIPLFHVPAYLRQIADEIDAPASQAEPSTLPSLEQLATAHENATEAGERTPMTVAELAEWCTAALAEGYGDLLINVDVAGKEPGIHHRAALNRPRIMKAFGWKGETLTVEMAGWPFSLVEPAGY